MIAVVIGGSISGVTTPRPYREECRGRVCIRLPLPHVQLFLGDVGVAQNLQAYVVDPLESEDRRGANGEGFAAMLDELLDGLPTYHDVFAMHLVVADVLALHGLERAGTHGEGQFLAVDARGVEVGEHSLGEVQSGRRGCHRTLYLGIEGLVGAIVALLRLTVQVGWDGEFAHRLKDFGEG